jgi:hypothetical protein
MMMMIGDDKNKDPTHTYHTSRQSKPMTSSNQTFCKICTNQSAAVTRMDAGGITPA